MDRFVAKVAGDAQDRPRKLTLQLFPSFWKCDAKSRKETVAKFKTQFSAFLSDIQGVKTEAVLAKSKGKKKAAPKKGAAKKGAVKKTARKSKKLLSPVTY